jgi:hypothetical protein
MKLKFFVANKNAIKLYLIGLCIGHPEFPPSSKREREKFCSFISGKKIDILPDSYELYKALKISILRKKLDIKKFKETLQRTLDGLNRVKLSNKIKNKEAKKTVTGLKSLFKKHQKKIDDFFGKQKISNKSFDVFVMPGFGESGRSLGDVILIGDKFENNEVAFSILMEEILHSLDRMGYLDLFMQKHIKSSDKQLVREALVGAKLYQLLSFLKIDKKVVDSVVFGWKEGKREKLIRGILIKGLKQKTPPSRFGR